MNTADRGAHLSGGSILACVLLLLLTAMAGYPGYAGSRGGGSILSTDTVQVTPVDTYITPEDTGSKARSVGCEFGTVAMSHRDHGAHGITCVTCHHKHDNDERVKECSRCHKGLDGLDKMHDRCGNCHVRERVKTHCAACHERPRPEGLLGRLRSRDIELHSVKFSHAGHCSREEKCERCHESLDAGSWSKTGNYPAMKTCLECHDNRESSGSCTVCHRDVSHLTPVSHLDKKEWTARNGHGIDANTNRKACLQCHEQVECSRCHSGQIVPSVHPPDHVFTHGIDVRMGESDCTACHETRRSCGRCHEERP